jgi:hypothetical protein
MRAHSTVRDLESMGNGRYQLTRLNGDVLQVFVCECYSFGMAEYLETIENLGPLDAVIIDSAWCGYTDEAKVQCRAERVGLFKIGDFMAALNRPEYWSYLNEWEAKRFQNRGMS